MPSLTTEQVLSVSAEDRASAVLGQVEDRARKLKVTQDDLAASGLKAELSERKFENALRTASFAVQDVALAGGGLNTVMKATEVGVGLLSNTFANVSGPIGIVVIALSSVVQGALAFAGAQDKVAESTKAAKTTTEVYGDLITRLKDGLAGVNEQYAKLRDYLDAQKAIDDAAKHQAASEERLAPFLERKTELMAEEKDLAAKIKSEYEGLARLRNEMKTADADALASLKAAEEVRVAQVVADEEHARSLRQQIQQNSSDLKNEGAARAASTETEKAHQEEILRHLNLVRQLRVKAFEEYLAQIEAVRNAEREEAYAAVEAASDARAKVGALRNEMDRETLNSFDKQRASAADVYNKRVSDLIYLKQMGVATEQDLTNAQALYARERMRISGQEVAFHVQQWTALVGASFELVKAIAEGQHAGFETMKSIATAEAIVNTAVGVTKAISEENYYAAAAIAIAGAAQVAKIQTTSPGATGGVPAVPSLSGGTPAGPGAPSPGPAPAGNAYGLGGTSGGSVGGAGVLVVNFYGGATDEFVREVIDLAFRRGYLQSGFAGQRLKVPGG